MTTKFEDLEKRVARIEKISWTVLGMLLTKAGIEVAPLVTALMG